MKKILLIGLLAVLFSGCSVLPENPIALAPEAIGENAGRVGIIMTRIPQPDIYLPGADCLLCMAVASSANSELSNHVKSLPNEDVLELKPNMAELLKAKGTAVLVLEESFDLEALSSYSNAGVEGVAKKDFRSFREKYDIDKLLVIQVGSIGFKRTYASYVPTSDPKGWFYGAGYLVDLTSNRYEWYEPIEVEKSADGNWDEPAKFPGLTNAYFQAIELGKDRFYRAFKDQ